MAKNLVIVMAILALLVWNDASRNFLTGLKRFIPGHYVSAYNDALLIITGTNGSGSGFLCEMEGGPVIITNAHVAAANHSFQITNLQGVSIAAGNSAVAVNHDIVKMKPADNANVSKLFPVMEHVDENVNIGDPVVVLGNAEGANVVTSIEGKVVGMGPNLVEVDAPFVQGNSGSPIVHTKTGKVIGVATYLLVHHVNRASNDGVTEKTRRFGYRLDSVKVWEPINWPQFYAQADAVENIEKLSQDFITLFKGSRRNHIYSGNYQTATMRHAVVEVTRRNSLGTTLDGGSSVPRLLRELQFLCKSDLNAYQFPNSYDYFQRRLKEQSQLRQAIYRALTQN